MNQQPATTYWDVFPKLIRVSTSDQLQEVPLSLRGDVEAPLFFSSNTMIADVDENGIVTCGTQPGATIIIVGHSEEFFSIRYVQVEVYGAPVISEGLPT